MPFKSRQSLQSVCHTLPNSHYISHNFSCSPHDYWEALAVQKENRLLLSKSPFIDLFECSHHREMMKSRF